MHGVLCFSLEAPRVEIPEISRVVNQGSNITLNCTGNNFTELRWFHNDTIVAFKNTEWFLSPTLGVKLYIINVKSDDAGPYTCEGSNQKGRKSRDTFTLFVSTPPVVLLSPSVVVLRRGEQRELTCTASGCPQPTVEWRKQDDSTGAWTVVATGTTFFIPGESLSSKTNYSCVARNMAGIAASTVTVIQEGAKY